jgi:hypothetical protein
LGSFGEGPESPASWPPGAIFSDNQSANSVEKIKRYPLVHAEAQAENSAPKLSQRPYYFPSSALSKMPEALSDFDPDLPAVLELKSGWRMELRLRLSHVGEIDGLDIIETDVPAALGDVALAAFRRMRFRAAEIEGKPVASESVVVIGLEADPGSRALEIAVDEESD